MLQFVGLGACGSRIALQIEQLAPLYGLKPPVFYINFDQLDMKELGGVEKKRKLLIGSHGTGRTPQAGEEIALENKKTISDFLRDRLDRDKHTILLFGAGGGTGSGIAPVAIDILAKLKFETGAMLTFPDHIDVVTNQNAVYTLNKIMEQSSKLRPLILADNNYLSSSLKHDGEDWWGKVNIYIANSFLNIMTLIDAEDDRSSSERGIGNLDWGEVKRTFFVNGLCDIRLITIPQQQLQRPNWIDDFKKRVVDESLTGRYPLKDTLAYSGGVLLPSGFKSLEKCQEMFDAIKELTPNAAIRRWGTIFKDKVTTSEVGNIQYIKLVMISAGYKLPAEINKRIKSIKKDSARFVKTRDKKSKVDLSAGLSDVPNVSEGFRI